MTGDQNANQRGQSLTKDADQSLLGPRGSFAWRLRCGGRAFDRSSSRSRQVSGRDFSPASTKVGLGTNHLWNCFDLYFGRFGFSSDGQHSTLKQAGSVDECREQIERILEGGREAFLLRKARYGH